MSSQPEGTRTDRRREHTASYLAKGAEGLLFSPTRTALLVIDPVNDFLSDGGAGWEMTKATVKMHNVIGHLKQAIDWGADFHPELRPREGEIVLLPHKGIDVLLAIFSADAGSCANTGAANVQAAATIMRHA